MHKFLVLALFAGSVQANTLYQVNAQVIEQGIETSFPVFALADNGVSADSQSGNCTYIATLSPYVQGTLSLNATLKCIEDDAESRVTMPVFILKPGKDEASYELEDDGKVVWKYAVEIDPSQK